VNVQRNRLALMLLEMDRTDEALAELAQSERIAVRLRDLDPANAGYHRDLSYTLSLAARASLAQAEQSDAEPQRDAALERARVYSGRTIAALDEIQSRGIARGDEDRLKNSIRELLARVDQLDLR
jgi:hypothetical protein